MIGLRFIVGQLRRLHGLCAGAVWLRPEQQCHFACESNLSFSLNFSLNFSFNFNFDALHWPLVRAARRRSKNSVCCKVGATKMEPK